VVAQKEKKYELIDSLIFKHSRYSKKYIFFLSKLQIILSILIFLEELNILGRMFFVALMNSFQFLPSQVAALLKMVLD
jgi:hypothetical protein